MKTILTTLVLALGLAGPALAANTASGTDDTAASGQQAAPGKAEPQLPPVSSEPEITTASFGDWVLRCQKSGADKVCEVTQAITVEGQNGPVAQLAVGRLDKESSYRLTVVLPVNVTLGTPGRIILNGKTDAPVGLTWAKCLPTACFASAEATDEVLARLRANPNSKSEIQWQTGVGQSIGLPFSLRGFAQAFDGMSKPKG